MTTLGQCAFCRHLREGVTCAAFPDGIPNQIVMGFADHREPIDGDHGTQFEPRDDLNDSAKNLLASVQESFDEKEKGR